MTAGLTSTTTTGSRIVRTIDLEHHFVTPLYMETLRTNQTAPRIVEGKGLGYQEDSWIPIAATGAQPKLIDMGEGRIREMDESGVDFAVLSLTAPGVEPLEPAVAGRVARDVNDRLAEYVAKYPDRLGGMATIAPKDTDGAVRELERSVKELGFRGWHTHSNFGDSHLDEKRYWPILAKAEELDIPIYLHPTSPMIPELRTFGICLSGPTFGFGTEVMFVFLRMIHRGVFDAFPDLKIILGHFGEAFPFLLDRVDTAYRQGYAKPNPEIGPGSKELASHYVRKNMWVTTSGNYLPAAYYCTRDALGLDKILLATDHPFEKMALGIDFVKELPLSDEDRAKVCEGNAVGLGLAR
jgi:predicted TIM-barrel fold metal-dependent hydrolase